MRVEHDDVAAIRLEPAHCLVQGALGDLLQLGIEGEHHVVPRDGIPHPAVGRLELLARGGAKVHRLPGPPRQDRIE